MSGTVTPGTVRVERHIDHDHAVIAAQGRFEPLFQAYQEHVKRWELELDGLTYTMMRQGLAATVLHLCSRPVDEILGITINIKLPPINIFLGGDAVDSTVTGRVFVDGVETAESSRLYVQSHRSRTGDSRSVVEVDGLDVLEMFEQYYEKSPQVPGRFFEFGDRFVHVLALPEADRRWVRDLERDRVEGWLGGGLRPLDERIFRLRCGCSLEKLLGLTKGMFGEDPEGLFQGEPAIEALCPRCGMRWTVTREEFDAADPEE